MPGEERASADDDPGREAPAIEACCQPQPVGTVGEVGQRRLLAARVLVVGYPDLLPDDGTSCAPAVPFATRDFPYLRDTGKHLNLMLRLVARWNHAEYVDTYGPTIGHDMCKPPAQRWIEPLQPASPAAPAHPNAKGEEAMAGAVLERLTHGRHGR
jgi:hypothetical protein